LGGVKIGKGCIIGAGSLVNKNIPDFSIAVGVPAKRVKKREPAQKVLNPFGWYDISELDT
jgi:acetyltransferase-like isoleucine patch superfamily enzyme